MNISTIAGTRQLGLVAVAALAVGLVAAAPAANATETADAPSASVTNGTLTIAGTNGADDVTLSIADSTHLLVNLGDGTGTHAFDRGTFTNISAFLGNGNDTFVATGVPTPVSVDGGTGDDSITGGAGDDLLAGGSGADTILGGDGNDVVFGDSGSDTVDGQRGTDTEFLGSGSDHAIWLPGEGNDAIDGGTGNDTLLFNGANVNENFVVTADGPHAVLTRNVANIRMDLNNVDTLDLATFQGNDNVTLGDLSGTDLTQADIDLGAARGSGADGQLDTITASGTDNADHARVTADESAVNVNGLPTDVHVSGADTRDRLQLDTGAGNDRVSVSDAAQASIEVGVDLGADQH